MTLRTILLIILNLFPLSEIILAIGKRARSGSAHVADKGSLKTLWGVILAAISLAAIVSFTSRLPLPLSANQADLLSLLFVTGGMVLRWVSIFILGRHFTVNVAIVPGHHLIETGPYRRVRHPSYTGLLLAFFGTGLFLNNWLALGILMLPICRAVVHRIRIEEAVLEKAFGSSYGEYRRRTKRLIPFIW